MEFDSCISGIDDSSCCDSDVDTDHAWLRRGTYSIVKLPQFNRRLVRKLPETGELWRLWDFSGTLVNYICHWYRPYNSCCITIYLH